MQEPITLYKLIVLYMLERSGFPLTRTQVTDFLLNREEAHNAMFREAFNKVQDSGSNKDFGVTRDSTLYFNLSSPSPKENHLEKIDGKPVCFSGKN